MNTRNRVIVMQSPRGVVILGGRRKVILQHGVKVRGGIGIGRAVSFRIKIGGLDSADPESEKFKSVGTKK